METYELTISKRINHFTSAEWFIVKELESGEELGDDFDLFEEAEEFLRAKIKGGAGKYFTNLKLAEGYAYTLSKLPSGSESYGNCEICKKHADSVYVLTKKRRAWCQKQKQDILSHEKSYFGHRCCILEQTADF